MVTQEIEFSGFGFIKYNIYLILQSVFYFVSVSIWKQNIKDLQNSKNGNRLLKAYKAVKWIYNTI